MTRNGYMRRLIDALTTMGGVVIPHTDHNAWALIAWAQAEHAVSDSHPQALCNLLNTTQKMPGSWQFNSVGVQNYPDAETGIAATAKTMLQKNPAFGYVAIIQHLHQDDPAKQTLEAVEASSWGTGGLALEVLPGVRTDYWRYAKAHVLGT